MEKKYSVTCKVAKTGAQYVYQQGKVSTRRDRDRERGLGTGDRFIFFGSDLA